MEKFFATCPRGLEKVLAEELTALGASDVAPVDGGVAFGGDLRLCYAANLESRVASRVLWQAGRARYRSERDIFDAARCRGRGTSTSAARSGSTSRRSSPLSRASTSSR